MFFQIFLAIFLGLACPSHSHKNSDGTTVTTQGETDSNDDGGVGQTGHIPPGDTPPPPPPPPAF